MEKTKRSIIKRKLDYRALAESVSDLIGRHVKPVTVYRIHRGYQQGKEIEDAIQKLIANQK